MPTSAPAVAKSSAPPTARQTGNPLAIAIVGMGGIFPGASTLDAFWQIIEQGKDVSRCVPKGRWVLEAEKIQSFTPGAPDAVYTDRACFVDPFTVDTTGLNLPHGLLERLDPMFHLVIEAGRNAFNSARLESIHRSRIGVMIGNIALPTTASSALCEEILKPILARKFGIHLDEGITAELKTHPLNRYVMGLPAGLLAQALNLGGGTCAFDAACASSLYALKFACDELTAGRADAMLAGGLSRPDSLYTQMGFSQLRALAVSGRCTPFDAAASGLIVGEGCGIVVLKRLDDALRDGDTIHAVIRGVGLSNDLDGNLLSPSSEGQIRALRQAYRNADWRPDQVDFIECHATGTPVGDAVEFESLLKLWSECEWNPGQCALGAVKANVGHLLTAAGSASLIKVLLAMKHGVLPPVANFQNASMRVALHNSPFQILTRSRAWSQRNADTPRRAAINGFGFGGINAHVLIEEWRAEKKSKPVKPKPTTEPKSVSSQTRPSVAIVGMGVHVGPWHDLNSFSERVLGGGISRVPRARSHWRGVSAEEIPLYKHTPHPGPLPAGEGECQAVTGQNTSAGTLAGYFLEDLSIPVNRYRIPPKELAELLPQQALMLEVARAALDDAHLSAVDSARAGVFIGLGLDLRTTDYHFRWVMLDEAGRWTDDPVRVRQIQESAGLPLTADRTLGALAGTNASRIAKEFDFGGPSFTVSNEDASGLRALELAVRSLQNGELDHALVGAVELTGDLRTLIADDACPLPNPLPSDGKGRRTAPGEGAVSLVLKRVEDAQRDGDRIYTVINGIGAASSNDAAASAIERAGADGGVDLRHVDFVECSAGGNTQHDIAEADAISKAFDVKRLHRCMLGNSKADVGNTGAASGLVSVAKAALSLHHKIIPSFHGATHPIPVFANSEHVSLPRYPQPWVRDRSSGPRRAGVAASSVDGNCLHVLLEEFQQSNADFQSAVSQTSSLQNVAVTGRPVLPTKWNFARSDALFVFHAEDVSALQAQQDELKLLASEARTKSVEQLSEQWWRSRSHGNSGAHRLVIFAEDREQLLELLREATNRIRNSTESKVERRPDREKIFYVPAQRKMQGEVAFVFPGSGSHFAEMGRELALRWPGVVERQDGNNQNLASQMCVDQFWNTNPEADPIRDHRALICGQVSLGTLVSDLARLFGLHPNAAIGYSLGESAALFAMRAWQDRDEMLRRVTASTLFTEDLTGRPEALRKIWNLPPEYNPSWKCGLVDRPAAVVRAASGELNRVYVLIINTPNECIIGGDTEQIDALIVKLGCHWFGFDGVTTVHCELLKPFEDAYRRLHLFATTPPAGVRFYGGGWGRSYVPDRQSAAEAIVAQASDCIDFPRVIEAAYEDGVRFFVEIGPGNSCSRMIPQILGNRPHIARPLCVSAYEPVAAFMKTLAQLYVEGLPVDFGAAFEQSRVETTTQDQPDAGTKCVQIAITGAPIVVPPSLSPNSPPVPVPAQESRNLESEKVGKWESEIPAVSRRASTFPLCDIPATPALDPFEAELFAAIESTQVATLEAHQAYLDVSQNIYRDISQALEEQMALISRSSDPSPWTPPKGVQAGLAEGGAHTDPAQSPTEPVFMNRAACLEFARGSIAAVLGSEFAEVEKFPTRVRLPDEPLMLVDRIVEVEGHARSMTRGRVVTEHDIRAGAWYLDCGRIPTCIAVEAGQADLFLSGYLGIDFQTRGLAVYRLLDARVCFHRSLPGPGSVIHYDIRIEQFFRQADTWLFRFNFEATVNGEPLLTMTDGCAGFFSEQELAGGKGIVRTSMDLKPMAGKRGPRWVDFVPMEVESYTSEQLEALRRGELEKCFGGRFANLPVKRPLTLPGGLMTLVHRIVHLDPIGGRFGTGIVRGEADIHPKDWFLTCHFVDDRVMPGTLMFECCLHTLRVFLLRMGWIVEEGGAVLEPIPGVVSQLKCRGQVLETTRTATYEISIKEIGLEPEPYVIADALMYADGKPIVEITNMSLRYQGATREMLQSVWTRMNPLQRKSPIFGPERILAFAIGKPSDAFGKPYEIFDEQRRIARLPGPPYQFLDRVVDIQNAEAFKMTPGGGVETEYDVPIDEWYFSENRQGDMPFAILLEVALQPCGWLAAYLGSALTSEIDLSFRNLGGTGTQFFPVLPNVGTLAVRVKITRVSSSAGMIIQWFDFEVLAGSQTIYRGDTYFGFFPKAALAKQEGLHGAKLYAPSPEENGRSRSLDYPTPPPFAGGQLRMIDHIETFIPDGGTVKLGFIRATKVVNPDEWFFKAHFYQDPVVPGSLGLESFLQLLKFMAIERWGHQEGVRWEAVAMNQKHEWTYRGQVIPSDKLVTVEATVTAVDDAKKMLTGDGFLSVDGRVIYAMKDFTVAQCPEVKAGLR